MTGEAEPYVDEEWWRDHYSGAMLDLWRSIIPPERSAEDVEFLFRHCNLKPGDRVLDVPCGEGRIAIELAARGLDVMGIDIAPGQIVLAWQAAQERGVTVEWWLDDMRKLPGTFDAVVCWGDSFGYLDDGGNADFLASVRKVLKAGGRFALEMQMVAEIVLPKLTYTSSGRAGDFDVTITRSFDEGTRRLSVLYKLERDGTSEERFASYRIYSVAELRALVEAAGFEINRVAARDGRAFVAGKDTLRMICTAV